MAYTNKEKIKFERCLFKIAEPELKKIYGDFNIFENQTDI